MADALPGSLLLEQGNNRLLVADHVEDSALSGNGQTKAVGAPIRATRVVSPG
jgi:hypothetical protein